MGIMDNEGHDPNGLGNRRSYATEIMELRYHYGAMEAALAVRDAENERLRGLLWIAVLCFEGENGPVLTNPDHWTVQAKAILGMLGNAVEQTPHPKQGNLHE